MFHLKIFQDYPYIRISNSKLTLNSGTKHYFEMKFLVVAIILTWLQEMHERK